MWAAFIDRRFKFAVAAVVAVVVVALAVFRGLDLADRRQRILTDNEQLASNRARIVAQYLHEVFAVTDASLRQIAILNQRVGGPLAPGKEWVPILGAAAAGLTGVGSISITDAQGTIRYSTMESIVGQSRHNDYLFQRLASDPKDDFVASTPFRTLTQPSRIVIPVGRRLSGRDGAFQGIVAATVFPDELRDFIRTAKEGEPSEISVFHPGGFLLFEEPEGTSHIGEIAAGNVVFEAARSGRPGLIRGATREGGPVMLSAYQPTPEPLLFVAVSVSESDILAEWKRVAITNAFGFAAAAVLAAVVVTVMFRQVEARAAAETALQKEMMRREREEAEAGAARSLVAAKAAFADELERKNRELEAFSYSVSHDLRAPLRSIDGFSQLLLEEQNARLDERGQEHLRVVRAAAQRMGELIDDLLNLSRVSRADLRRDEVDLSAQAIEIEESLRKLDPQRKVSFLVQRGLQVRADPALMKILLENLLGNAWKFTAHAEQARIEFACRNSGEVPIYFIRDNGAGFNMTYSSKLFRPFQRLHRQSEFPGTGVGLATVYRVVERHGGRIWAEGVPGKGAVFFFTIPEDSGVIYGSNS